MQDLNLRLAACRAGVTATRNFLSAPSRVPEDLSDSVGDHMVFAVAECPDHDPQSDLALGQYGDPRIAIPELADDLIGLERGMKSAPLDHDLGDMIGDLGDLLPRAHPGDLSKLSDDLRRSGLPGAPF